MNISKKDIRTGEEKHNNQGCLMKIVEYINCDNIVVEFQDLYKIRIHTNYSAFLKGVVKNPYCPSIYNVGIIGNKYPVSINSRAIKEYDAWNGLLRRCFDKKLKEKYLTYKNISCCDEWLYYENFYEWLHSQENFDKLSNGCRWEVDKDILVKSNKIYSPKTCCLVPHNINCLFIKSDASRSNLPIGVIKKDNKFIARCNNPFTNSREWLCSCSTPEQAFLAYKKRKEEIIKQVAEIEYEKGNIAEKCYDAMMNYEVEIDD